MTRILTLLLCLAATAARAEMLVHDGDRVVFMGDSITEFGNYTNPVEAYFSLRYPEMKVEWINAGWAGDGTEGGLYRLERDVLALKPTLVTICFGMNDGYYMKPEAWVGDLFAKNLTTLVTRIQATGARVALMTPGRVNEEGEKNKWMKDVNYNAGGLDMLRRKALEVAAATKAPITDLHSLFGTVLGAALKAEPNFEFTPDGIHPDEGGALVMSYALLQALGVPPRSDEVVVDLKAGTVTASAGISAGALTTSADGTVSFNMNVGGLPYFVSEKARKILPYLPLQKDFNHLGLRIHGLDAVAALEIGPAPTAFMQPAALEAGLALEELWDSGPMQAAEEVGIFCVEKTKAYLELWRNLALKPNFNQWETSYRPEIHRLAVEGNLKLQESERAMALKGREFTVKILPLPKAGEALNNGDWVRAYGLSPRLEAGASIKESAATAADFGQKPGFWTPRRLNAERPEDNLGFWLGGGKAVGYAALRLESPLAQSAELKLGADDSFEAFLNGKPVGKSKKEGGLKPDLDVLALNLRQGSNLLLIKIIQKGKAAGLCARFGGLKQPLRSWPLGLP